MRGVAACIGLAACGRVGFDTAADRGERTVWPAAHEIRGTEGTSTEDDPFLTPDRLTIYFTSDRPSSGKTGGMSDVYVGHRARTSDAFEIEAVVAVNSDAEEHSPELADDGHTLYFTSERNKSTGGDVFASTIDGDTYATPVRVDSLSSGDDENDVTLSGDGLVVMVARESDPGDVHHLMRATRRSTGDAFGALEELSELEVQLVEPAGMALDDDGSTMYLHANEPRDLFVTRQGPDGSYRAPERLDELDTAGRDDGPCISLDGRHLVFARDGDLFETDD